MATWTMTDKSRRYERQITKTLLVSGQYLVSFSGVADIGGNTEHWLIEKFSEIAKDAHKQEQIKPFLINVIGAELRRLRGRQYRAFSQHALWFSLLVVGYAGSPSQPFLAVLTNAKDATYGQARVKNYKEFADLTPSIETRDDFQMWAVGSTPPKADLENAADAIRRYRAREPGHSIEIAKTLARMMRTPRSSAVLHRRSTAGP